MATKYIFPGIGKIKFKVKRSKNPMAFHYYDAGIVTAGRNERMAEFAAAVMAVHSLRREVVTSSVAETKKFPWNGEG